MWLQAGKKYDLGERRAKFKWKFRSLQEENFSFSYHSDPINRWKSIWLKCAWQLAHVNDFPSHLVYSHFFISQFHSFENPSMCCRQRSFILIEWIAVSVGDLEVRWQLRFSIETHTWGSTLKVSGCDWAHKQEEISWFESRNPEVSGSYWRLFEIPLLLVFFQISRLLRFRAHEISCRKTSDEFEAFEIWCTCFSDIKPREKNYKSFFTLFRVSFHSPEITVYVTISIKLSSSLENELLLLWTKVFKKKNVECSFYFHCHFAFQNSTI